MAMGSRREGYSYRASMHAVRELLAGAGSAEAVEREELLAHRADILEVRDRAGRLGASGSPIAQLFSLSEDVIRLIQRLAAEGSAALTTADVSIPVTRLRDVPPATTRLG
jgi:hypothetical protein